MNLSFCRLHSLGRTVGVKLIDLYFVRERNSKREIKLLNILLFVKSTLWKVVLILLENALIITFDYIVGIIWQRGR